MMKHKRLRKPFKIMIYAMVVVVLLYGMVIAFVVGVSDTSFRYDPPTASEIAENPELVRYSSVQK